MTTGQSLAAVKVLLGELGFISAGPTLPKRSVEHLRRSVRLGEPFNFDLSYLATGNPHATRVLLVHGTPGAATGWADYLSAPQQNIEWVAVDRPGFGHSGPATAVASLTAQAAAIAALLAVDGRPTILVGHSLGGAIAALIAAEHVDRVSALVLVAASLDPALERVHPMQHVGALPGIRHLLPRAIRNANAELMALKPQLEALAAQLGKVRAPTFILHGTADRLVPVANVGFIQKVMQQAVSMHTELLDGRNHFLPWNSVGDTREIIDRAIAAASPPW